MSTPLDYLTAPDFAASHLTEAINIPDYKTGRPAQLGIFKDTPIATTFVRLGFDEQELFLIPARERGGESNVNTRGNKKGVDFHIPHFPLDDSIRPSDLQNIIAWGPDYIMQSLNDVYTKRLEDLRAKHDVTHSHLDWGALNGLVLDGSGKEILNIYEEFEIEPTEIVVSLSTATFDVAKMNRDVKASIRKELRGVAATGIRCLAGKTFFDTYISHAFVKEQLASYHGQTPNPGRDDVEDTFTFAGLVRHQRP